MNQQITSNQVFSLMVLFLLGSTVVVGLSLDSEEEAWLVNMIATAAGIVIYFLYIWILRIEPRRKTFTELLKTSFGKWIGTCFICLYAVYFLYIGMRVVKDFEFFISTVLFYNIETWVIGFVFILLAGYACILGLEAIARVSELLFFGSIMMIALTTLITILNPMFEWTNVLPLIKPDWRSVIGSVFPAKIAFPFGELIAFLMIFPAVNNQSYLLKRGWMAVVFSGLIIIAITESIIGMLGAKIAVYFSYPLIKSIETIDLLDFFQHIEILSVIVFFFVGFIKVVLLCYAAIKSLSEIMPRVKNNHLVYGVLSAGFASTFFMDKSIVEHTKTGLEFVPKYIHLPFQFGIPLLLLAILLLKKMLRKKKAAEQDK
ncbi:endospore germination permease [Metabacillus indicus]|uniref:GerAB/ArcD/ProY family transporter n=1 Tax=Metabacillus indicus TaxID=246786 RepID=UPI0029FFCCC9|nr:endospore germination permease [Metabacillus indicus]MDX8288636.1 endospore germination permease [Metabacillus indicus]